MTKEHDHGLYATLATPGAEERRCYLRDGLTSTYVVPGDWIASATATAFVPRYAAITGRSGGPMLENEDASESNNDIQYFIEGRDVYAAMRNDIRDAMRIGRRGFVGHLGWTCWSETVLGGGHTYLEMLESLEAANVMTRLLYWMGNPGLWADFDATDRTMVAIAERDMTHVRAVRDNQTRTIPIGVPVGSHHQKLWVILGSHGLSAYIGGCDIHPNRIQSLDGKPPWHDVHARVIGPAAERIAAFLLWRMLACVDWGSAPLPTPWTPPEGLTGSPPVAALAQHQDTYHAYEKLRTYLGQGSGVRHHSGPDVNRARVYVGQTIGNPQLQAAGLRSCIRPIVEGAIQRARRFVYVEDQYFWHPEVARMLGEAVASGQIKELVVLTQISLGLAENPTATRFGLQHLAHAAQARIHNVHVFERADEKYVHSKTFVYDDVCAHTGSANFNRRGYEHDSESACVTVDRIDDIVDWHAVYSSVARNLRARLWNKHLGVSATHLHDGLGAMTYWRQVAARVSGDPSALRDPLIEGEGQVNVRLVRVDGLPWYTWAESVDEPPPDSMPDGAGRVASFDWLNDPAP